MHKIYFVLFILSTSFQYAIAQKEGSFPTFEDFMELQEEYKTPIISDMYSTIDDIEPLIKKMKAEAAWTVNKEGESLEGRPIYSLTYGTGPTKVMLWSQMHGNEPTATMAIMDILNTYIEDAPELRNLWAFLGEKLTIRFIPMLNPDGAESFTRRNAAHIDINRDAARTASPEAKILRRNAETFKPDFGFNLHDQEIYYRAGRDGKQVAIAFLAPAYNYANEINDVRRNAMKLMSILADSITPVIPEHVARYKTSFEPRAFGDNFQRWGTSTILIESGGYPDDPQKQYLRKLNYALLMKSFIHIAQEDYKDVSIESYMALPFNQSKMLSLLIKDAIYIVNGYKVPIDIGYKGSLIDPEYGHRFTDNHIVRIGDLSVFSGLETFDAQEMYILPGDIAPLPKALHKMKRADFLKLLKNGVHTLLVKEIPQNASAYPMVFTTEKKDLNQEYSRVDIRRWTDPAFFLGHAGKPEYLVHNGQVLTLEEAAAQMVQ